MCKWSIKELISFSVCSQICLIIVDGIEHFWMLDDSNVNKYNRLANSSTHMFTQKPATLNINTLIELRTHNFAINIYLLFAYIHRQRCQH